MSISGVGCVSRSVAFNWQKCSPNRKLNPSISPYLLSFDSWKRFEESCLPRIQRTERRSNASRSDREQSILTPRSWIKVKPVSWSKLLCVARSSRKAPINRFSCCAGITLRIARSSEYIFWSPTMHHSSSVSYFLYEAVDVLWHYSSSPPPCL